MRGSERASLEASEVHELGDVELSQLRGVRLLYKRD